MLTALLHCCTFYVFWIFELKLLSVKTMSLPAIGIQYNDKLTYRWNNNHLFENWKKTKCNYMHTRLLKGPLFVCNHQSSHFNRLACDTILARSSNSFVTLGHRSDNCYQIKYLVPSKGYRTIEVKVKVFGL